MRRRRRTRGTLFGSSIGFRNNTKPFENIQGTESLSHRERAIVIAMNLRMSILVVVLCVYASSRGDEPVSAKPWEGVWAAVSVVNSGEQMPEERAKKLRLTLTADRYKTKLGDQLLFDSTYTI